MVIFAEMSKTPMQDRIFIPYDGLADSMQAVGIAFSRPTYDRGVKELIEKQFLAEGVHSGWFFINPALIFNGDRAAFVRTYQVKPPKPTKTEALEAQGQQRLPMDIPAELPLGSGPDIPTLGDYFEQHKGGKHE